jgi:hypothetical protein
LAKFVSLVPFNLLWVVLDVVKLNRKLTAKVWYLNCRQLLELWISFGCLSLRQFFHLRVCILVLLLLGYVSAAVKTLSGFNIAGLKHSWTAVPIWLVLPVLSRLVSVFGECKGISSG